eukprot:6462166-Amphidinium_carterae.1
MAPSSMWISSSNVRAACCKTTSSHHAVHPMLMSQCSGLCIILALSCITELLWDEVRGDS